jgi:hypothetical protein
MDTFVPRGAIFPWVLSQDKCLSLKYPCSVLRAHYLFWRQVGKVRERELLFHHPPLFLVNVAVCWGSVRLKAKKAVFMFLLELFITTMFVNSLIYPASVLLCFLIRAHLLTQIGPTYVPWGCSSPGGLQNTELCFGALLSESLPDTSIHHHEISLNLPNKWKIRFELGYHCLFIKTKHVFSLLTFAQGLTENTFEEMH